MIERLVIILLFMFYCDKSEAQIKRAIYSYKVVNPVFLDNLKKDYVGKEYEFETIREYKNDSCFIEKGIFSSDTNTVFEMKHENCKWYFRSNKTSSNWKLFFNNDTSLVPTIELWGVFFLVHWYKNEFWIGSKEYVFRLIPPKNVNISHFPIFFFNSENGIIGIKNNEVILLRDGLIEDY